MGTYRQQPPASAQRSLDDVVRDAGFDDALLRRVHALEAELEAVHALVRRQAEEREVLEADVARLREANENLILATFNAEDQREDAEAANRRQNEFLAMLAHELRNPLSPLAMAASLLERDAGAAPQQLRLASVISRQVDHMARLLDDLLDAARISSGKITLTVESLAMADVLRHAVETVQPRIAERGQALDVELPAGAVAVEGDKVRLAQVFTNLLGNASKYTGDGGRLRLAAQAGPNEIVVTIADNGTGIAPEVLPYIFDLFTQGPRSLARSEGGLGVGLNVVRNLVGMHHGTVEAHSDGPGCGSRFTVRLPRAAGVPAAPVVPEPAQATPRRRILLVEDNEDASATLADILLTQGHEVVCEADGRAGLARALAEPWDVIVCDIGLPELDGLKLMQALRAQQEGARPYAIALTGYGQPDDEARGLAAGFDRYLVKPVGAAALLAVVADAPAPVSTFSA
ncbi:hybrid sensor histidine kinase/response regulator [Telluria mixta]|uniref:histidine kinase n=1 Tax=Telluria mixta TaxID=34071 RepID=A0ABT2BRP3_9BURK|nr:hybrid sensor histidine kinase/response regulator [Telluria mixta]MCS0627787.1 hybrid sensor histidine kinase/response regulator [Telluria mixta]WEM94092.1 hybrid sensor histidine kinase/response regulator [Telluria mixta]